MSDFSDEKDISSSLLTLIEKQAFESVDSVITILVIEVDTFC